MRSRRGPGGGRPRRSWGNRRGVPRPPIVSLGRERGRNGPGACGSPGAGCGGEGCGQSLRVNTFVRDVLWHRHLASCGTQSS